MYKIPILKSKTASFVHLCSSLMLIMLLTSCMGSRRLQEDIHNSRDNRRSNFIQTKDGSVVEGEALKVKYPFLRKAYVQINEQDKVNLRDIEVMQNDVGYYRKINGLLAPRIKKGGINTYLTYETRTTYSGTGGVGNRGGFRTTTVPVYFVQKSDSGTVLRMTPIVVEEMVADYQPALDFMDQYNLTRKQARTWSWLNTAAVFGGIALIASGAGDDANASVKPQVYVGGGLLIGGLINGMVNKVRKASNYRNVELAIDEYNAQGTRRRR